MSRKFVFGVALLAVLAFSVVAVDMVYAEEVPATAGGMIVEEMQVWPFCPFWEDGYRCRWLSDGEIGEFRRGGGFRWDDTRWDDSRWNDYRRGEFRRGGFYGDGFEPGRGWGGGRDRGNGFCWRWSS